MDNNNHVEIVTISDSEEDSNQVDDEIKVESNLPAQADFSNNFDGYYCSDNNINQENGDYALYFNEETEDDDDVIFFDQDEHQEPRYEFYKNEPETDENEERKDPFANCITINEENGTDEGTELLMEIGDSTARANNNLKNRVIRLTEEELQQIIQREKEKALREAGISNQQFSQNNSNDRMDEHSNDFFSNRNPRKIRNRRRRKSKRSFVQSSRRGHPQDFKTPDRIRESIPPVWDIFPNFGSTPLESPLSQQQESQGELYDPFKPCRTPSPSMPSNCRLDNLEFKNCGCRCNSNEAVPEELLTFKDNVERTSFITFVIDNSKKNKKTKLNNLKADLVKRAIKSALDAAVRRGGERLPNIDSIHLIGKRVKIVCKNQFSLTWLKRTLENVPPLWPNALLSCTYNSASKIPKMTKKLTLWLPPPIEPFEVSRKRIKKQNPWMSISDQWKLFYNSVKENPPGRLLMYAVNEKDVKHLEAHNFRLSYKHTIIKVKISNYYANKTKTNSNNKNNYDNNNNNSCNSQIPAPSLINANNVGGGFKYF